MFILFKKNLCPPVIKKCFSVEISCVYIHMLSFFFSSLLLPLLPLCEKYIKDLEDIFFLFVSYFLASCMCTCSMSVIALCIIQKTFRGCLYIYIYILLCTTRGVYLQKKISIMLIIKSRYFKNFKYLAQVNTKHIIAVYIYLNICFLLAVHFIT